MDEKKAARAVTRAVESLRIGKRATPLFLSYPRRNDVVSTAAEMLAKTMALCRHG